MYKRRMVNVSMFSNLETHCRRKLLNFIPNKEVLSGYKQVSHVKAITGKGLRVDIYNFDKNPMFFQLEDDGNLYPSVYFTWISSDYIPLLYAHEACFKNIENGADLMLPGLIRKEKFPEFIKNSPVAISVITMNGYIKGPLAIGVSLMSSTEVIASNFQGRGVHILHTFRDNLWESGDRSSPPENSIRLQIIPTDSADDFPPLSADDHTHIHESEVQTDKIDEEMKNMSLKEDNSVETTDGDASGSVDMDELLQRCFIAALVYRVGKDKDLPLNVGEFYSHYLLKTVPPMRRLDMKKTRFKKFLNFINYINEVDQTPVIHLMAKAKGSEEITEINWTHPLLKRFELQDEVITDGEKKDLKVIVKEKYSLTEPSLLLFKLYGYSKGDLLDLSQIRQLIMTYVRSKGLNEGKHVSLKDDILSSLIKHEGALIDWNTLIQKISSILTKSFVIVKPDGSEKVVKKLLPKISFKIEQRAGNKKVTIVDNLSVYGVDCKRFCQQVQLGVATTANLINTAPGCEGPQAIVQGNQIRFMNVLLNNEYGISDKYMMGLNLARKQKN